MSRIEVRWLNIIPAWKLQAGNALFARSRKYNGMNLDNEKTNEKTQAIETARLRKYRVAGTGFLGLNSIYIALAWGFMPPFVPGFPKEIFWPLVLVLILFLTKKILDRKTTWVKTLAIFSGFRFVASLSLILGGDFLPVVPYFLPCFILTFYLLGRAGWNWP